MERIEADDPLAFMQGQLAGLELALRALIGASPELRATLATAASRLAPGIALNAPPDFAAGLHHTLRRVNGGSLPVLGAVPD